MSRYNVQHERARVAALSRSRLFDDPDLVESRRRLKAAKWDRWVQELLATEPPLTKEQREALAFLVRGEGDGK